MLLIVAESISNAFADELDQTGSSWKLMQPSEMLRQTSFDAHWQSAVIVERSIEAASLLLNDLRTRHLQGPIVVVLPSNHAGMLNSDPTDAFDDFVFTPLHPGELASRVQRVARRFSPAVNSNLISYGGIELNVSTYQASVAGRPLDMTYMEYELLKYFVMNRQQVLTREQLLRDVWRYEYYGGARTVDVHVRRLRAKLGDEYAQLIQTVRSVGYMFGQDRYAG